MDYQLLRIIDYDGFDEIDKNDGIIYFATYKKKQIAFSRNYDERRWFKRIDWVMLFLAISLCTILVYLITYGREEIINGIGQYWDFLYQLSIAYVASTIFYYMTIRIPENNRRKRIDKAIEIRGKEILDGMKGVLREIFSAVEIPYLSETQMDTPSSNEMLYIDFEKSSSVADINRILSPQIKYLTIFEFYRERVSAIRKQTEALLTVYHNEMSVDTLCLLEEVRNAYLNDEVLIELIDKTPKLIFDKSDGILEQYKDLIRRLNQLLKKL